MLSEYARSPEGIEDALSALTLATSVGAVFVPSNPEVVSVLRHRCAASGFHDHDGCTCADRELLARPTMDRR